MPLGADGTVLIVAEEGALGPATFNGTDVRDYFARGALKERDLQFLKEHLDLRVVTSNFCHIKIYLSLEVQLSNIIIFPNTTQAKLKSKSQPLP